MPRFRLTLAVFFALVFPALAPAATPAIDSVQAPGVFKSAAGFTHPGILHSRADLDRMHAMVQAGVQPWARGFEALREVPQSSLAYLVQGPFKDVRYENGQYEFRRDASAAYNLAIMWICTADDRYAVKSLGIIRAWAREMETFDRGDHLTAGMGVNKFAAAAEIFRYTAGSGWTEADTVAFTAFLERIKPALDKPNLFMNQGGYALMGMTAIAVFTDDAAFYHHTILRATVGDHADPRKDPALSKTIWPSGQVAEMGRDQTHPQGGLGTLACIAQTAAIQGPSLTGLDLFDAFDQRLLKGFEYLAAHNLGYDRDYLSVDLDGHAGLYQKFSPTDRGKFSPIFELVYQHYRYVKHVPPASLRYCGEVRDYRMPEGFSEDFPGFGTLLFSQPGARESTPPLGPPRTLAAGPSQVSASGRLLAANFSYTHGVGREYYTDITGHTDLVASNIQAGDYTRYDGVDFGVEPVDTFIARAGSASPAGSNIDIFLDTLDSKPVGTLHLANTGWWSTFETFSTKLIRPISGKHAVFLKFYGGNHVYKFECNLYWFRFLDDAAAVRELAATNATARFPVIAGSRYGAAVSGSARRTGAAAELKTDGTTLSFLSVEFSSGAKAIGLTLAGGADGRIEVRRGDAHATVIASIQIPSAPSSKPSPQGFTLIAPFSASAAPLKGNQMLFLTFIGDGAPVRLLNLQLDPSS